MYANCLNECISSLNSFLLILDYGTSLNLSFTTLQFLCDLFFPSLFIHAVDNGFPYSLYPNRIGSTNVLRIQSTLSNKELQFFICFGRIWVISNWNSRPLILLCNKTAFKLFLQLSINIRQSSGS